MTRLGTVALLVAVTALGACSRDRVPELMNFRDEGSNEFAILPTKPLEEPPSFSDLPDPTPGRNNRTDPTPKADAVAALGGRPDRLQGGGPSSAALISHTTRFGVDPAIRDELAAADLAWRRANPGRVLERWFNVSTYLKAYRPFHLDQYRELERFRRAGVRTPAAPPEDPQF